MAVVAAVVKKSIAIFTYKHSVFSLDMKTKVARHRLHMKTKLVQHVLRINIKHLTCDI